MAESTLDITARMKDYFARQIAHYEEMLHDYTTLTDYLRREEWDVVSSRQAQHAAKSKVLEDEFRALLKEWQGAEPADEERDEVRKLAGHAEALALKLVDIHTMASEQLDARLKTLRQELDEVRRGRNVLDKYRVEGGEGPGFIDRKA